jgi:hypothetical protein
MGLPVNLEESAMLSGSFARVRIDDIVEVLEARFPGPLPTDLAGRLARLGRDELKQVLRRPVSTTDDQRPDFDQPSGLHDPVRSLHRSVQTKRRRRTMSAASGSGLEGNNLPPRADHLPSICSL